MGSTYAVGKVKRKLNAKCGHMGTLDPLASGVLPVGVGKATRMFDFLLSKQKEYIAEFEFGYETDTLDSKGAQTESGGRIPTKEEITCVLGDLVGEVDQIPPKYSAKLVAGKRGYELARKGVDFTLPAKRVSIYSLECMAEVSPGKFRIKIQCGGGTYVRSIGRDLAYRLGTFATMTSLVRTAAGIFNEANSVDLDEFLSSDTPEKYLVPVDEAVSFERIFLTEEEATRLLNGVYDDYPQAEGYYRVYAPEGFWGIGEIVEGKLKMRAYCRDD